jgi:hypothetical protein
MEMLERLTSTIRRLGFLPSLPGRCSFCRRPYNEAGPFAEGYDSALICGECVAKCGELIAKGRERISSPGACGNPIDAQSGSSSAQP